MPGMRQRVGESCQISQKRRFALIETGQVMQFTCQQLCK